MTAPNPDRFRNHFHPLGLLPYLVAVFLVLDWPFARDYDVYLHLKSGRWMVEHLALLRFDVFSYTASGMPAELHSWLSQVVFWLVYQGIGEGGIRALAFCLVVGFMFFAQRYASREAKDWRAGVVASSASLLLIQSCFYFRPLLFGVFLFSALLLGVLAELKPLPPVKWGWTFLLTLLWANLHGSVVMAPFLFLWFGVLLYFQIRSEGRPARTINKWEWLSILGALPVFAVACLNPNGPSVFSHAFQMSQLGRVIGNNDWNPLHPFAWLIQSGLAHYQAFDSGAMDCLELVGLFLLPLAVWVDADALPKRLYRGGFCLFFLFLPLVSNRHLVYLIFPFSYFAAILLPAARARIQIRPWAAKISLAALALGLFFVCRVNAPAPLPSIEKASQFLAETELTGRLFNEPDWGDYLIYKNFPRLKVAISWSLWLHRDLFEIALERKRADLPTLPAMFAKTGGADLMMVPFEDWIQGLRDDKKWIPIFQNGHALIALRRDAENRDNLRKVSDYYARQGVPFDPVQGFDLPLAFSRAPEWVIAHQDGSDLGRWPVPALKKKWVDAEKKLYADLRLEALGSALYE